MSSQEIFTFKMDISKLEIPAQLNNPFGLDPPEIAKIASREFQDFLLIDAQKWKHDFMDQKGKMFGVLVVETEDGSYAFLGAASGRIPENASSESFVPSVFDDSVDGFFINKGMTALTEMSQKINQTTDSMAVLALKEARKKKSIDLQKQLFEHYQFSNLMGKVENLLNIFKQSNHGNPPSAAGECAAPKLLQFAIQHQLKPIAIAEFWWGSTTKYKDREHQFFYPACKDKCRPILEYMLGDTELYNHAQNG